MEGLSALTSLRVLRLDNNALTSVDGVALGGLRALPLSDSLTRAACCRASSLGPLSPLTV